MLSEFFIGKRPSNFHINPLVKAFIISECFLWSAWNFIIPIFAIFAVNNIIGGKIELAASGYSIHLVFRVIFELIIGRYLSKRPDIQMIRIAIFGSLLLSVSYLGFIVTATIPMFFFYYAVAGIGFGILSPAKKTLFAIHLDKDKASVEWGLTDAIVFICIALAAALGGFIAQTYGFRTLFVLSAIINTISIVPYLLYSEHLKEKENLT
ncbi:MFS transporter [Candidatus Roizmanbacteria bacterium]|nr:MFS transporter [Candidatus Roizmanbacteria bacterium]